MNNIKNNRYQKTDQLIKDVFIELVETRGYSNVTVKDIVTRAKINRNSFYLHYQDKEDLIDRMFFEVVSNQEKEFLKLDQFGNIKKDAFNTFIDVVYEQIEFYRVLLKDPNLSGYFTRLEEKFKRYIRLKYNHNSFYSNVYINFKASGFLGILKEWILFDRYSKEEMVELFNNELMLKKDTN